MNLYWIIKKILQFAPLLGILVFIIPWKYKEFWEYAWYLLIVIMFVRPLADITKLRVLKLITSLRKELGIIVGSFSLAHVIGYFLERNVPLSLLWDSIMWDPMGYLWVWMFAFIIAIILTATSNIFSMKKLWKYWKKLQRLSYLMFIFVLMHIAFIKWEYIPQLILFLLYSTVYILAYKKISYNMEPYVLSFQKRIWIKK